MDWKVHRITGLMEEKKVKAINYWACIVYVYPLVYAFTKRTHVTDTKIHMYGTPGLKNPPISCIIKL